MIPISADKEKVIQVMDKVRAMDWPDRKLIRELMEMLGIYDIVELEVTLNSLDKRERFAALKMIEENLDGLTSGDLAQWTDSKDTLNQIYYKVEEIDEEGFL